MKALILEICKNVYIIYECNMSPLTSSAEWCLREGHREQVSFVQRETES